jgi:hypothetical protein
VSDFLDRGRRRTAPGIRRDVHALGHRGLRGVDGVGSVAEVVDLELGVVDTKTEVTAAMKCMSEQTIADQRWIATVLAHTVG